MVVPVRPVPGLEGDYITHQNNIVKKLSRHEVTDMYCSGIQVVHPRKISALMRPVTNFYDVWKELISRERLYCSTLYPEAWYAVDTLEQLSRLPNNS